MMLALAVGPPATAQPADPATLAASASVVVQGVVIRPASSDEPLLTASPRTAVVAVRRMLAGGEFVGDLTGRTITVILAGQGGAQGEEMIFFGNPRYAGKGLTIADVAETPLRGAMSTETESSLIQGVQARQDAPVLARLTIASAVFSGQVEETAPIAKASDQAGREPVTEHDPDYHSASIRVRTPIRGVETGQVVTVIYPASRDIMWFNVAKLTPDMSAVFIAHPPSNDEVNKLRPFGVLGFVERTRALVLNDINDVLPPTDEKRIIGLDLKRANR
jgi:hypothetical protein